MQRLGVALSWVQWTIAVSKNSMKYGCGSKVSSLPMHIMYFTSVTAGIYGLGHETAAVSLPGFAINW